jgi:hypothetical protein
MKGRRGKINLSRGKVPVARVWAQGERAYGCQWWLCFVSIYGNRIMTPVEFFLRSEMGERGSMTEGEKSS